MRTTIPGELSARPADLVKRTFSAPASNRLWVADAGLRVILIPQWGINGAAVAAAAGVALWNVVLWRLARRPLAMTSTILGGRPRAQPKSPRA